MARHANDAQLRERSQSIRIRGVYCLASLVWFSFAIFGFWVLLDHDTSTGTDDNRSAVHGLNTTLVQNSVSARSTELLKELIPAPGQLSIVMALHPTCPCTRSSLAELERLLETESTTSQCVFLVALPSDKSMSWIDTDTTMLAKGLPNSRIIVDVDAKLATQLGIENSGGILVVQPNGTVSFSGGITSGRTCTQENPGSVAVASLIRGEAVQAITTPTFGCPLN